MGRQAILDVKHHLTLYLSMIRSFRHKGLATLWETSGAKGLDKRLRERVLRRLEALHAARRPRDVSLPGFDFHRLQGKPVRYSIHVNGPWCITFEFDDDQGDAYRVDLENYH